MASSRSPDAAMTYERQAIAVADFLLEAAAQCEKQAKEHRALATKVLRPPADTDVYLRWENGAPVIRFVTEVAS